MSRKPIFNGPRFFAPSNYFVTPNDYHAADTSTTGYPDGWGDRMPPLPPLPPPPPPPQSQPPSGLPPPPLPPAPPPPPPPRIRGLFDPAPLPRPQNYYPNHAPQPPMPTYYGSWDNRSMPNMGAYNGGYVGSYDYYNPPQSSNQNWCQESDFVGDSWQPQMNYAYGGQYTAFDETERTSAHPPPFPYVQSSRQNQDTIQAQDMELDESGDAGTSSANAAPVVASSTVVSSAASSSSTVSSSVPVVVPKVVEEEEDDDDDEGDWRRCDACEVNFENEAAYNRHSRGMIHTQKLLEKAAGISKPPPVVEASPRTSSTVVISKPEKVEPRSEYADGNWKRQRQRISDPEKRDLKPSDIGKRDDHIYCELCKISCSSEGTFQSHLDGKKHLKALRAKTPSYDMAHQERNGLLRGSNAVPVQARKNDSKPIEKESVQSKESVSAKDTGKVAFIQKKIDTFAEPLIGLQFLVEYVMNDFTEPRYICNLCEAKCDPRTVVSHLIGYKHRLRYMKEIRSDIYAAIQMAPSDATARQMLQEKAAEIEQSEGRAKIRQKCDQSLLGVVEVKPPVRLNDGKAGNDPGVGTSTTRNENFKMSNQEEFMRSESAHSNYSADEPQVAKIDYPYYSIRAQRGHVRATDERDAFYVLEQGYYYLRHQRNYGRYDELYVTPFIGQKRKSPTSELSSLLKAPSSGSKMSDTLKLLVTALVKVSSGAKNGNTLAVSTALTKALTKFKEVKKQADEQRSVSEPKVAEPEPERNSRSFEPPVSHNTATRTPPPDAYALRAPGFRHRVILSPSRRPPRSQFVDEELESLLTMHVQSQQRRAAAAAAVMNVDIPPPPPKRKLGAGYNS